MADYTVRVDKVSPTITYAGRAVPGSSESSAVWQIRKVTISGALITVDFANGQATFVNVWDNRLSLSYS